MKIQNDSTEILWKISGGNATEYDSLKGKDVFEFFRILRAYSKKK